MVSMRKPISIASSAHTLDLVAIHNLCNCELAPLSLFFSQPWRSMNRVRLKRPVNSQPFTEPISEIMPSSHRYQQTSATVVGLGALDGLSPFVSSSHDDVTVAMSIANPVES